MSFCRVKVWSRALLAGAAVAVGVGVAPTAEAVVVTIPGGSTIDTAHYSKQGIQNLIGYFKQFLAQGPNPVAENAIAELNRALLMDDYYDPERKYRTPIPSGQQLVPPTLRAAAFEPLNQTLAAAPVVPASPFVIPERPPAPPSMARPLADAAPQGWATPPTPQTSSAYGFVVPERPPAPPSMARHFAPITLSTQPAHQNWPGHAFKIPAHPPAPRSMAKPAPGTALPVQPASTLFMQPPARRPSTTPLGSQPLQTAPSATPPIGALQKPAAQQNNAALIQEQQDIASVRRLFARHPDNLTQAAGEVIAFQSQLRRQGPDQSQRFYRALERTLNAGDPRNRVNFYAVLAREMAMQCGLEGLPNLAGLFQTRADQLRTYGQSPSPVPLNLYPLSFLQQHSDSYYNHVTANMANETKEIDRIFTRLSNDPAAAYDLVIRGIERYDRESAPRRATRFEAGTIARSEKLGPQFRAKYMEALVVRGTAMLRHFYPGFVDLIQRSDALAAQYRAIGSNPHATLDHVRAHSATSIAIQNDFSVRRLAFNNNAQGGANNLVPGTTDAPTNAQAPPVEPTLPPIRVLTDFLPDDARGFRSFMASRQPAPPAPNAVQEPQPDPDRTPEQDLFSMSDLSIADHEETTESIPPGARAAIARKSTAARWLRALDPERPSVENEDSETFNAPEELVQQVSEADTVELPSSKADTAAAPSTNSKTRKRQMPPKAGRAGKK